MFYLFIQVNANKFKVQHVNFWFLEYFLTHSLFVYPSETNDLSKLRTVDIKTLFVLYLTINVLEVVQREMIQSMWTRSPLGFLKTHLSQKELKGKPCCKPNQFREVEV